MEPQLTPRAVLEIAASINPAWGKKLAIVQRVGRHPDGLYAPYRELAELIGGAELFVLEERKRKNRSRYVHRLLRELVRDRVLLLLEKPAGRRPAKYALNPRLAEWREVPWVTPVELVWFRAFGLDAQAASAATNPGSAAINDRGTMAVVTRSGIAALRDAQRLSPRSLVAAQREALAAILDRGTTGLEPQKQFSISGDGDDSVPVALGEPDTEEFADEVMGLAKSIQRYNGWKFIADQVIRRVDRLVAKHSIAYVAERVALVAPAPRNPLWFLRELELACAPEVAIPTPALALVPDVPAGPAVPAPYTAEPAGDRGDFAAGVAAARASLGVTGPVHTGDVAMGGAP